VEDEFWFHWIGMHTIVVYVIHRSLLGTGEAAGSSELFKAATLGSFGGLGCLGSFGCFGCLGGFGCLGSFGSFGRRPRFFNNGISGSSDISIVDKDMSFGTST